jgi:hypothetical protein
LLTFCVALVGCQSASEPSRVAHYTRNDSGQYEIRLDYTHWSNGGGPCNTLQLLPGKVDATDWIYTRSIDGEVPADQLILTGAQGMTRDPTPVSGSVTFAQNKMRVALQYLPLKNPSPSDPHGAYELNGEYDLQSDQPTTRPVR